jgi:hypothetical protein
MLHPEQHNGFRFTCKCRRESLNRNGGAGPLRAGLGGDVLDLVGVTAADVTGFVLAAYAGLLDWADAANRLQAAVTTRAGT